MKHTKLKLFGVLAVFTIVLVAVARIAFIGDYAAAAVLLFAGLAAIDTLVAGASPFNFSGRLNATPGVLGAATLNYQLTSYAQGLWNDLMDVTKLAERLAPTTPVPGAAGQFKKFDDKNSFMPEKTARAQGSDPVLIGFNATDDAYSCRAQALEVRVDKTELQAAGVDGGDVANDLLDQGKIKALLNKAALSHVLDVCTAVLAGTTAVANRGNWSNPDIDPIDQIDEQLLALTGNCGSTQNIKLTMDVASWNALRNHPKIKARALFGAASSVASISTDMLNSALLFPCDIMIANIVYDTTRLAQAPNKVRALAGTCLLHYAVPGATLYDPSAFKSFTVGGAGFLGNVYTYQALNNLWRGHLVDWSRDIKQTSTLSMIRLGIN